MRITSILKALILLPLILALQSTFPLSIKGVRPDLFLVLAIHYGLRGRGSGVAYAGFLCGLVQNVMTVGAWNPNPISKGIIALYAYHRKGKNPSQRLGIRVILLVAATLFDGILHAAILRPGSQAVTVITCSTALNLITGLPLLLLMDAMEERLNLTTTNLAGKG